MAEVKLDPVFKVSFTYAEMKLVTLSLGGHLKPSDEWAARELAVKLVQRQADELSHYHSILAAAAKTMTAEEQS